jgi:hypothetical protein
MSVSKIKSKIKQLQRIAPKHSRYGQLYAAKSETQGFYSKVRLWTLFVSDENEHMLRPHVFESKKKRRNAREWHDWFSRHFGEVMRNGVLPGLSRHTDLSKQWSVKRILGWRADAKSKSNNPGLRRRRHKATKARRSNG